MPKWAQRPKECEIDGLSGFSPKLDPSFYFRHTYLLTETWDPPFRRFPFHDFRSCIDHATLPLESQNPETRLVPTAIVPQPFREFFLSLFGISRTGSLKLSIPKSLPPLLPELQKTKMPKSHTKGTPRFMTSGFSMQRVSVPCHRNFRYAEPRITEILKFHT
jgi:hypothetical protein